MDISAIKPLERQHELKHPKTDEPMGIFFTIVSTEDERLKRLQRNFTNRALQLRARGKMPTADELEEQKISYVAEAIIDWNWKNEEFGLNGEKCPEYSKKNVLELLKISWIRDQIDEEVGNLKAFF